MEMVPMMHCFGPRHETGSGDEFRHRIFCIQSKWYGCSGLILEDLSFVDLATSFVLGDGDPSLFGFTMQVVDDLEDGV